MDGITDTSAGSEGLTEARSGLWQPWFRRLTAALSSGHNSLLDGNKPPAQHSYPSIMLHGVTSKKTVFFFIKGRAGKLWVVDLEFLRTSTVEVTQWR